MPRRLALAFALACLAPAAWADFLAEYTPSGEPGNAPALSRIEVVGDHMRTDAGKVSMLFDVGSGKMIVLMHDKKQYMDMAKVAETAGAAMAQANAALANLPPEQRAMIEQRMQGSMMGAGAKMVVSVKPTGASDRVGAWACQVYTTSVGDRHVDDSCLADVADAGISAADRATVHRAFDQIKAMTEKMSAGMFKSPMNQIPDGKFPVRITHFDDNGKTQTVVLKGISSGGIGAGDFAIPPGYTEQEINAGRRH
jgi:hypothetical protein